MEIGSYINTAPYTDGVAYKAVGSAYLWPLSSKEAYYTNSDLRTASDNWWLRSQGSNSGRAAEVFSDGYVNYKGYNVYSGEGVRPAFNINLESIILTSAAENGKPTGSAGTLKAPVDYTGTDWKLTIKDTSLVINPGNAYKSGNTVTVPYTFSGSPNRISVLITDKDYTANDAKIKYYGAIAEGSSLGTSATFTLPGDVADTDNIYLLAETVSGNKKTDLASDPVELTISTPESISNAMVSLDKTSLVYNGSQQSVSVNSVKIGDKILTAGTDYTVSGNLAGIDANTYSVTVTGIGNYKDSKIVTWDITRKPVTVSANSLGKVYGSNNPVLTATVTGTIGTDTVSYTLSRAAGENVNTYTITPNIAAQIQGNYSVSGVTGTFTITRKPVTITAKNQTVALNGNIVTGTSQVNIDGLVSGDELSVITLTSSSTASATTGGTITPGNAVIKKSTTDVTANYQMTYQNGKLTVNKGTVTYTAPTAKTLTYNGKEQTLVNAGIVSSNGAKMLYSLSENGVYGEEIPAAKESGSYKVWYRIDGGTDYEDVAPASVDVTIKPLPVYSVSVTDDGHGYGTASPSSGNAGTLITISASADQGYSFKEWQVVSGSVTLKDSKKVDTTFTLGNSDVTIKAVFKKKSSPSPTPYTPPYNPSSDSSGGSGDDIASGSSSGSQRDNSFDYLNELIVKLAQAVAANKEQTIYWDKGIMLPYDIMKSLQDHPKITLIFFYNYQGFNYLTCIPGKNVKANPAIPWYGPVYLFLYYGINAVPVSVPGASLIPTTPINTYVVQKGDTLSKIAVRIGKSVNHLATTNGIKNKNLIKVGQVLRY